MQLLEQALRVALVGEGPGLHVERGGRRLRAARELIRHAGSQRLHFDQRRAVPDHVELRGRGVGEVDEAVGDEGAAIVDAHDDAAAVAEVGDARIARKRQRLVGGGHPVHVVGLAAGGVAAVERRAVPGGHAALEVAVGGRQHEVAPAEHLVEGRVAVGAARLGARHGIGD